MTVNELIPGKIYREVRSRRPYDWVFRFRSYDIGPSNLILMSGAMATDNMQHYPGNKLGVSLLSVFEEVPPHILEIFLSKEKDSISLGLLEEIQRMQIPTSCDNYSIY